MENGTIIMTNALRLGKWRVVCDRCGFKRYSDEVVKTWDNFYVCAPSTGKTCFETRHPLDLIRAKPEDVSVPYTRREPADTFVTVAYVASTVGIQETTIPAGNFTTNNETI